MNVYGHSSNFNNSEHSIGQGAGDLKGNAKSRLKKKKSLEPNCLQRLSTLLSWTMYTTDPKMTTCEKNGTVFGEHHDLFPCVAPL